MLDISTIAAKIIILLVALPIHEFAHGYAAYLLGDPTAKQQGRLTLNPLAHLDFLGSILIFFTGFGWAKPVPFDVRYFKNKKMGIALTAIAGPLSNFVVSAVFAVVAGVILRFTTTPTPFVVSLLSILQLAMVLNIGLAVFNLIPVPPLDGSKVLNVFLPYTLYYKVLKYESFGFIALIILLNTRFFTAALNGVINLAASPLLVIVGLIVRL